MITYCIIFNFQIRHAFQTSSHIRSVKRGIKISVLVALVPKSSENIREVLQRVIIKPRPPILPKMTYFSKEIDDFPL